MVLSKETGNPMCHDCGHVFDEDPAVGRAYTFLYSEYGGEFYTVGQRGFQDDLEEAVLDMGNDTPDKAAAAICYALTMGGWPEPDDIQAAVLHRQTHRG